MGTAEQGCYIKQDTQLAYPYCCPRSFCPTNSFTDIISNSLDTGELTVQPSLSYIT